MPLMTKIATWTIFVLVSRKTLFPGSALTQPYIKFSGYQNYFISFSQQYFPAVRHSIAENIVLSVSELINSRGTDHVRCARSDVRHLRIYKTKWMPTFDTIQEWMWILVFNATFSNISGISWRPVLVVEEASTRREPPTLGKQLVNFITCGCESSTPFLQFTRPPGSIRHCSSRST
jgi:hypothetical protein